MARKVLERLDNKVLDEIIDSLTEHKLREIIEATAQTVEGLGARKNALVLEVLRRDGVEVYEGSVRFVEAARDAGLRRAVVSASKNCRRCSTPPASTTLFEVRIDGVVAEQPACAGSPRPTCSSPPPPRSASGPSTAPSSRTRSPGSKRVAPGGSAGSSASIAAGQAELRDHGADIVVADLGELLEAR